MYREGLCILKIIKPKISLELDNQISLYMLVYNIIML